MWGVCSETARVNWAGCGVFPCWCAVVSGVSQFLRRKLKKCIVPNLNS